MALTMSKTFEQFRSRIRHFVEEELEPVALKAEHDAVIPDEIVENMRQLGLFGISIPKTYGG